MKRYSDKKLQFTIGIIEFTNGKYWIINCVFCIKKNRPQINESRFSYEKSNFLYLTVNLFLFLLQWFVQFWISSFS